MRRTAQTTKESSTAVPRPPGTGLTSSDAAWMDVSVKVGNSLYPLLHPIHIPRSQPYEWMKLRVDVNASFKAGTIVSLSDEIEPPYATPTKVSQTPTCHPRVSPIHTRF